MAVTKNYINVYRSPDNIYKQLQEVIESFLSYGKSKIDPAQANLIDKIKSLEMHITPQIMHVFEAPLDKHDFKDLVKQLIAIVMDDIIDRAYSSGIITKDESDRINKALDESKRIEFCSIYNPSYLM